MDVFPAYITLDLSMHWKPLQVVLLRICLISTYMINQMAVHASISHWHIMSGKKKGLHLKPLIFPSLNRQFSVSSLNVFCNDFFLQRNPTHTVSDEDFDLKLEAGESRVISALNCTSSVRILKYLPDACFYSFMDILTQMVLRNCISIAWGGKEKKIYCCILLGIVRHASWVHVLHSYSTPTWKFYEEMSINFNHKWATGKKVEQKLICHYKKTETTKNKKTGAVSPQRKIHYSFFWIKVHHIISMCETWLISKPTQFMSWKVGNCGTLKTGHSRIHLNQWTWMGQLLKCLSLLWTLNVLNLFKHTYMVT